MAFLALVPSGAVSTGLYDVIKVISALFPFKPTLDALNSALNRSGSIGLPLRAPHDPHARLRRARPPRRSAASPDQSASGPALFTVWMAKLLRTSDTPGTPSSLSSRKRS